MGYAYIYVYVYIFVCITRRSSSNSMPLSFDLLRLIFYAALNAAVLRLVSALLSLPLPLLLLLLLSFTWLLWQIENPKAVKINVRSEGVAIFLANCQSACCSNKVAKDPNVSASL